MHPLRFASRRPTGGAVLAHLRSTCPPDTIVAAAATSAVPFWRALRYTLPKSRAGSAGYDQSKQVRDELTALKPELTEHRMVRMPILDWADPRDVTAGSKRSCRWSCRRRCTNRSSSPNSMPNWLLLRGGSSLNEWGWVMDDVVLLPLLRVFTCVKGVKLPPEAQAYLYAGESHMIDYGPHAL